MSYVKDNGCILKLLPYSLINDKEVVLKAVKNNIRAQNYASQQIKDLCLGKDPVVVLNSLIRF